MTKVSIYKIYLAFLITLVSLPILAPIFLKLGFTDGAKVIYFIYSFTCHQFHTRSLYLFDHQYAWCARDTGIWIGWLTAAILVYKNYLPKLKFYWLLIFALPIAIDGGLQTVLTITRVTVEGSLLGDIAHVSNNLLRFTTGSFFGFGMGWWISNQLKEVSFNNFENVQTKVQVKRTAFTMIFLMFVYFTLVQLWYISSTEVKPTNIFDSQAKIQRTNFFERRKDGVCPTSDGELLGLECFF